MEFAGSKVTKEDDDSQEREDEQKINKSIQVYKSHMTLIKLKMSKADTLIRQYNDKMKECELLNEELTTARGEKQDILNKYNLTMEKNTRLELASIDYQQTLDKYRALSDNQRIKLDENEQHINQLLFKIKDNEVKNSALEDEVKILQQDLLKACKTSIKSPEKNSDIQSKQQACQTIDIETKDISVNTDAIKDVPKKPKMKDECTITENSIERKKEPFSFYCTKCEAEIKPAPVEQILKIMTQEPPFLPSNFSPPNSPRKIRTVATMPNRSIEIDKYKPIETISDSSKHHDNENFKSPSYELFKNATKITSKSHNFSHKSSIIIEELTQKVNKLESSMKKVRSKKNQGNCHKNCCPSKNIQVVLKLPSEEQYFDYRKREKLKLKRLQHLHNKVKTKSKENDTNNEWQIEDCLAPKKRKITLNQEKKHSKSRQKVTSLERIIDLFGSENDLSHSKESPDSKSCTTLSSNLVEMDVDVREEICTQNISTKNSVMDIANAFSSSVTSQVTVSNNTNDLVLKEVDVLEEDFVGSKICNKNNLQSNIILGIEETENGKEIISLSNINNQIIENDLIEETKDNRQNVNISSNIINMNCTFDKNNLSLNIKNIEKNNLIVTESNEKYQENNSSSICHKEKVEETNVSLSETCENNIFTDEDELSRNVENIEIRKEINIKNTDNNEENTLNIQKLHDEVYKDTTKQKSLMDSQTLETNEIVTQQLLENEINYQPQEKQNESHKKCEENTQIELATILNLDNEIKCEELSSNNDDIKENNSTLQDTNNDSDICKSLLKKKNYGENEQFENINLNDENASKRENLVTNKLSEEFNSDSLSSYESFDSRIFSGSEIPPSSVDGNIYDDVELDGQQQNLTEDIQPNHSHRLPVIITKNNHPASMVVSNISSFNTIEESSLSMEVSHDTFDTDQTMPVDENNISHKQIEITKENNNFSSDESSDTRFFSASGLKRTKSNHANVILSDESSEEKSVKALNVKRKRLNENPSPAVTRGKKLLSKIRNIKKISSSSIIASKLESRTSQVEEEPFSISSTSIESFSNLNKSIELPSGSNVSLEITPVSISSKKLRIAHTPKSINSNKDPETVHQIKNVIGKTKSNPKKEMKETNDKLSSILEEYNKTCKERREIMRNLKALEPVVPESTSFRNKKNITNDLLEEQMSQEVETNEILPSEFDSSNVDELSSIENRVARARSVEREKRISDNNLDKSPIKELRSRQVVINKLVDETNSCLGNTTVVSHLNEYLSSAKSSYKTKKNFIHIQKHQKNEQFFQEKFNLLMESEEWTAEVNTQVLNNLVYTLDLRTIAFFIMEYTETKIPVGEKFDRSHTPPAPIMTRSEQKIVTLILSIDKQFPEFSNTIMSGIHFRIFRLTAKSNEVHIVERLFRILVVLNKIKKDREKVRIFCCDALYCLNIRAIDIIHVALMCWPEILPHHDSNNDIIVKTIVHIIMTQQVNKPHTRLINLRKHLSSYYKYPDSGYKTEDFKEELLQNLIQNVPGISTAVLLLCKKMGPAWTMENIVTKLKQMIATQTHPSLYDALTLLGNILRSFPTTDPNNKVGEIIDQLCDVLAHNEGADDLQEGVVSCLLSLNKVKYEQIARSVVIWQSKKDLRPATKDKLDSFIKQHDAKWWWKFIKTNFPLPKKN